MHTPQLGQLQAEDDQPIAIIRKNSREELRVELSHWQGHDLVQLRLWFNDQGRMRPGRSGFAMNVAALPELAAAINAALAEAVRRDLVQP
jgi:hypothetical protein